MPISFYFTINTNKRKTLDFLDTLKYCVYTVYVTSITVITIITSRITK